MAQLGSNKGESAEGEAPLPPLSLSDLSEDAWPEGVLPEAAWPEGGKEGWAEEGWAEGGLCPPLASFTATHDLSGGSAADTASTGHEEAGDALQEALERREDGSAFLEACLADEGSLEPLESMAIDGALGELLDESLEPGESHSLAGSEAQALGALGALGSPSPAAADEARPRMPQGSMPQGSMSRRVKSVRHSRARKTITGDMDSGGMDELLSEFLELGSGAEVRRHALKKELGDDLRQPEARRVNAMINAPRQRTWHGDE